VHLSVIPQERNYEIALFLPEFFLPSSLSLSLSFPICCWPSMEKHGTRHLNQSSLTNEDEAFQNVAFHIRVSAYSVRCVLNRIFFSFLFFRIILPLLQLKVGVL
jgi:hypothetical protein